MYLESFVFIMIIYRGFSLIAFFFGAKHPHKCRVDAYSQELTISPRELFYQTHFRVKLILLESYDEMR